ncbi:MAG: hypothetical protein ABIC91_04690 [Nanoarchaeota archaeon]|nr:hypothetical protein [Nanoarchaeota archaeon]MBU1030672.1 hypothetical protein [Nanoarchaeota archaeon]MBU1849331.1 hypothetical protein [Nanoarchaeota archaeon]
MVEGTITTTVDDLLELLKNKDNMAIEEVASKLKVPIKVVQSWIDFLVEEKILGIEFKFTKPFVYLNKPKNIIPELIEDEMPSIDKIKEDFKRKAEEKRISQKDVKNLWQNHILEEVEKKKDFFFKESRKRGFFNPEDLWIKYKKNLVKL